MTIDSLISAHVAVEGPTDEVILRPLLAHAGIAPPAFFLGKKGKGHLDQNIKRYNRAAETQPFIVVRDLDHDEPCAPELVARLLPSPSENLLLRIAVRQVESWLLADRQAIASHFAVPKTAIPHTPDSLDNPKRALVACLQRSRRREVRERMTPRPDSGAVVGPEYPSGIEAFVEQSWSVARAAEGSPSLARCVAAMERLTARLRE